MRIGAAPSGRRLMCCVDSKFWRPGGCKRVAVFCLGPVRRAPIWRANACFSHFSLSSRTRTKSPLVIEIGIKASATASSYVFLQQELARGLRLSQPSRVAKDAARGELLGCNRRLCVASSPTAHEAVADAAPARQSLRDATRDCCSTVCTRESAVAAKRAIRDDALTDIV